MFLLNLMPVVALCVGALMVVLRAGASRVFFDVVGTFQAARLIDDAKTKVTVLQSLMLDGLSGIGESASLVMEQMQNVVDEVEPLARQIENARIEFQKFANFADAAAVESEIIKIGESFAFTADQALEAGARMAQLGGIVGGGAAVGAATEVGIQFGLIGGMDTQTAMTRIVNLQQQTNFMYGELTKAQYDLLTAEEQANVVRQNSIMLLNSLNTVENRSAATMDQITKVMNQFAAQGHLAGDSITYMAAASATLIEAGEEQGKAGRALRMMYARLGANTANNAEVLAEYGVAVRDATGNLRSMEDLMYDLSRAMKGQSEADRMRVAQAIAGNDHYVRAIKLMENYDRTMELNHQSILGLDTAQEELERRMKTTTFQLEQQEAALVNYRAELGDNLLPAILVVKKEQVDLARAFAQLSGTELGGSLARGIVVVQQYMSQFQGIGEAYLNVMSTNVALQAQMSIVRALRGEEIARASAYGFKSQQAALGLASLEEELAILDKIVEKELQRLRMRGVEIQQYRMSGAVDERRVAQLDEAIVREKSILAAEQFRLQTAEKALLIQSTQERAITAEQQARVNFLREERTYALDNLAVGEREYHAAWALNELAEGRLWTQKQLNAYGKEGTTDAEKAALIEQRMNELFASGEIQASKRREAEKAFLEFRAQENERYLNANREINQTLRSNLAVTEFNKEQLAQESQQRALNIEQMRDEHNARVMKSAQSAQTVADLNEEIPAHRILAAAVRDVENAFDSNANAQANTGAMTEALKKHMKDLAVALDITEQRAYDLARALPVMTEQFRRAKDQQDILVKKMQHLNNQMMAASGVLGALSMAYGVLGDKENHARMQAVLMTASMVPAVYQMFALSAQTMATAAGMTAMAGATNAAAGATTRLGVAMNFLSKNKAMIGITAIAFAIGIAMNRLGDYSEDATESINTFSDGISASAYDLDVARQSFKDYEEAGTSAMDALLANQNELNEAIRIGEALQDDASKAKIAALKTEGEMLQDILNKQQADLLLNASDAEIADMFSRLQAMGTFDETEEATRMDRLFNTKAAKEYREARDANAEAQKGIFTAIEDEFGAGFRIAMNEDMIALAMASDSIDDFTRGLRHMFGILADPIPGGDGVMGGIIGPIEAAKEAIFEFSNAREEMFFGMSKGNLTGDMVKQVVNKGVETLINTTEVFMTNNFNGMTTQEAANEILRQVEKGLGGIGASLNA